MSTELTKNRFEIEKLEDRIAPAVGVGLGGLAGVGVAVDANVNVPIDIDVDTGDICVNVAAINSAAGC